MTPELKIGQVYRIANQVYNDIGSNSFGFLPYVNGVLHNNALEHECIQLKRGEVAMAVSETIGPIPCTGYRIDAPIHGFVFLTQSCEIFWVRIDVYELNFFEPV